MASKASYSSSTAAPYTSLQTLFPVFHREVSPASETRPCTFPATGKEPYLLLPVLIKTCLL